MALHPWCVVSWPGPGDGSHRHRCQNRNSHLWEHRCNCGATLPLAVEVER